MDAPRRRRPEKPVDFPYPLLVCDIGGTNVRIASVAARGDAPVAALHAETKSHSSLRTALETVQKRAPAPARSIVVCAAGPVSGAVVRLTNADWTIDGPALADALGLDQGLLLNDFEAQAVALPHLPSESLRPIGAGTADAGAPQLVFGPGTGLGAAALLRSDGKWLPVVTESGHIGFGPADAAEENIWPLLERVEGRVTYESVVSGPGLVRLDAALRSSLGQPASPRAAADVVAAARGGDAAAIAAIRLFWRLTARCAGDLALAFLPRGGVTLAGGVLPHLTDWLDEDEFRRAFADKAPMAGLLAEIPVQLATEPQSALLGMAALAAAPGAYAIDYAARAWRPVP